MAGNAALLLSVLLKKAVLSSLKNASLMIIITAAAMPEISMEQAAISTETKAEQAPAIIISGNSAKTAGQPAVSTVIRHMTADLRNK